MSIRVNLNQYARVRLNERGRMIYAAAHGQSRRAQYDAEGWTLLHLWEVMNILGPHLYNGCEMPCETTIEIEEGD